MKATVTITMPNGDVTVWEEVVSVDLTNTGGLVLMERVSPDHDPMPTGLYANGAWVKAEVQHHVEDDDEAAES